MYFFGCCDIEKYWKYIIFVNNFTYNISNQYKRFTSKKGTLWSTCDDKIKSHSIDFGVARLLKWNMRILDGCFKENYEYDNNIAAHRLAGLKILLCWKPVLFQSGTMAV